MENRLDEISKILAEAKMQVIGKAHEFFKKTEGVDVSEMGFRGTILDYIDNGDFAAFVYQPGRLCDWYTNEGLVIVNIPDRKAFVIFWRLRSTPYMYMGELYCKELVCEANNITVRYIDQDLVCNYRRDEQDILKEEKEQHLHYSSDLDSTGKLDARLMPIS